MASIHTRRRTLKRLDADVDRSVLNRLPDNVVLTRNVEAVCGSVVRMTKIGGALLEVVPRHQVFLVVTVSDSSYC